MENLEKSFLNPGGGEILESFGKVMEICCIHICIHAEFYIINMLFKKWRSKYKPAYALSILAAQIIRAASERTVTEKTKMFILLIWTIVSHSFESFKVIYCMLWNSHCWFNYDILSLFHVYIEI